MKKVLVTGAGGFIGSHLCEALARKGCRVRAMVRYNSRNSWGWLEGSARRLRIEVVCGDVRNADSVIAATKDRDTVFHLAALIGIPYSYQSPDSYVDTNIRGTLNVLQACGRNGVKRLVHTSTSEIYGTAQFVPISEKHPVNPQSPYAATKAAADFLALSFHRSFGLNVSVVRPFNTYGPRQSARAVIPTIITQLLEGKRAITLGSTAPTRDFNYVADTVAGFIAAAQTGAGDGGVTNIGSGREISIGELVALIASLMKMKVRVMTDDERVRPGASEVERLNCDASRASEIFGWRPRYTLEKGLSETIAWFRRNREHYKTGIYNV